MARKIEKQRTLAREIKFQGIGLHSGEKVTMHLIPVTSNTGIIFQRLDEQNRGTSILSNFSNVIDVSHATNLGDFNGHYVVKTVEHLLATLHAFGIDNLLIQLDALEVPIADGSSKPLADLIRKAGTKELPFFREKLRILKKIEYKDGDKFIRISPFNRLKLTYHIDFPNTFIGRQSFTYVLSKSSFIKKIAPARTFCLAEEVDMLRKHGLALGGSLENAIVVEKDHILNDNLRFDDEFVRHKVLDLLGDLFLLGKYVIGHVEVYKGGHALHNRLIREILSHPDAYSLETHREKSDYKATNNVISPIIDRMELFPQASNAL